ncbi:aldehyde dehydrogenase family protein [Massilia sp. H-1]|nr:aldehyde dehydrogenase family protein [Massilia sp. H-1]
MVGRVADASVQDVEAAIERAGAYAMDWQTTAPSERAAAIAKVADLFEENYEELMALAVREA